jgi:hypothetical protein
MPSLAAVARRDDRLPALPPGGDHAVDRRGREIGSVREHDHRRFGGKAFEAAAERGPGTPLPLGAADDGRVRVDVVGAEDDEHVVHRATANALEHLGQEQLLLRRAEARGGACGEDDGGDPCYLQPRSERQAAVTFATYATVSALGAPPVRSTADGPELYAASARSGESNRSRSCRR